MSAPQDNPQDLRLLLGAGASQPALAAYLESLDPERRIVQIRRLAGSDLAKLYDCCAGAPPLLLTDFVPANTPSGKVAIFGGKNSLPAFTFFEKHFTRLADGTVIGFNFQKMSFATGPGYFTVIEGDELLFDYTKVPAPDVVPAGWPRVQTNDHGISRFVYRGLHDFCRRVSSGVVIGHATRLGKPLGQYFALARARIS
jgi:hypothetical protein